MTNENLSFIDYWNRVDAFMGETYGIDTWDAGIEADELAAFDRQRHVLQHVTAAAFCGKRLGEPCNLDERHHAARSLVSANPMSRSSAKPTTPMVMIASRIWA